MLSMSAEIFPQFDFPEWMAQDRLAYPAVCMHGGMSTQLSK